MFEDDWLHPIVNGKNGDAGLVFGSSEWERRYALKRCLLNLLLLVSVRLSAFLKRLFFVFSNFLFKDSGVGS